MRATVAAFDFDGTLTRGDNVVPFMRRVAGVRRLVLGAARRLHRLAPALVRRDRDRIKAIMSEAAFTGVDQARIACEGRRFAELIVSDRLRPDALDRLRWHQSQGHRVVLVSASYELYLAPVAELLAVDAAIGTRLGFLGGRCTGRLAGGNCRAGEKWRRLEQWLAGEGFARDAVTLWAYGDSEGDRQLLEAADHPVWAKQPIASVAESS